MPQDRRVRRESFAAFPLLSCRELTRRQAPPAPDYPDPRDLQGRVALGDRPTLENSSKAPRFRLYTPRRLRRSERLYLVGACTTKITRVEDSAPVGIELNDERVAVALRRIESRPQSRP
jgi:hypothetical protein